MVLCLIVLVLVLQPLSQDGVLAMFETEALWLSPSGITLFSQETCRTDMKGEKLLCAVRKAVLQLVGETNKCLSGLHEAF